MKGLVNGCRQAIRLYYFPFIFAKKLCPGSLFGLQSGMLLFAACGKKARPPIHHVPNSGGHFGQVKWVDIYSSPVDRRIIMKRGNIFDPLECASVKMLMRAAPLCPPFPLCLQQKATTATLQAN